MITIKTQLYFIWKKNSIIYSQNSQRFDHGEAEKSRFWLIVSNPTPDIVEDWANFSDDDIIFNILKSELILLTKSLLLALRCSFSFNFSKFNDSIFVIDVYKCPKSIRTPNNAQGPMIRFPNCIGEEQVSETLKCEIKQLEMKSKAIKQDTRFNEVHYYVFPSLA